jgi:trehalose utilization protein
MPIRVTIWHEFRHEKKKPEIAKVYPDGMHEAIASHLRKSKDLEVRTATLDEPENGLTEEVLNNTDVLTWWGHGAHHEVIDLTVERVYKPRTPGHGPDRLAFGSLFKNLPQADGHDLQSEVARGQASARSYG